MNQSDANSPLPVAFESLRMLDSTTVEVVYRNNTVIKNEDIDGIYKAFDTFTENKRLKKLIVIGENVDISTETRFLIIKENTKRKENIIAEAVVVNSIAQKLKVNFYIMFLKKIYPTQFFTKTESAIEWLQQFS